MKEYRYIPDWFIPGMDFGFEPEEGDGFDNYNFD